MHAQMFSVLLVLYLCYLEMLCILSCGCFIVFANGWKQFIISFIITILLKKEKRNRKSTFKQRNIDKSYLELPEQIRCGFIERESKLGQKVQT